MSACFSAVGIVAAIFNQRKSFDIAEFEALLDVIRSLVASRSTSSQKDVAVCVSGSIKIGK